MDERIRRLAAEMDVGPGELLHMAREAACDEALVSIDRLQADEESELLWRLLKLQADGQPVCVA